ncbi:hypothetical protein Q4Q34_03940 [Flavivirga abyssicola]|uniref:hypothetical protein n=1 Tax=Flavivirga abyssicola TaxID=3063533 RepID=UPI0026DEAF48|nr:hypothetical protein [Flavivirga sp. MEBiC07777]WVK14180.1 hypothetical protein Q4Q34_03940 [Flavivirga sp. MEBiC07777]
MGVGIRTPSSFHLYCWADALESKLVIIPKKAETKQLIKQLQKSPANDNSKTCIIAVNDNKPEVLTNNDLID